jgi:hypothetical protein
MKSFLLIQPLSFNYDKISLFVSSENDSLSPTILLHFNEFKFIPSITIRLGLYNISFDKYTFSTNIITKKINTC